MFDVYMRKVVENGSIIFPKKFVLRDEDLSVSGNDGKKSVESLKRGMDAWLFSGQYLNDPVDLDTVEFKPSWFRSFVWDEETGKKLRTCGAMLSVDPAFRLKESNDFSGLVVTKTTPENFVYVVEAIKKKLNPMQLVNEIFNLYDRYKFNQCLVETVAAQIVLVTLLNDEMRKRNKYFQLVEVKQSTTETKAARIRGLIPRYANGQIFHASHLKELEAELIEFPRSSHDDLSDALSFQIPYWQGHTVVAPEREMVEGSLNWWKTKLRGRNTRIGDMFQDLSPVMR